MLIVKDPMFYFLLGNDKKANEMSDVRAVHNKDAEVAFANQRPISKKQLEAPHHSVKQFIKNTKTGLNVRSIHKFFKTYFNLSVTFFRM